MGEPKGLAADTLSAIQHPLEGLGELRRHIPIAWKLYEVWDTHEVPFRGPPLLPTQLRAMAGNALHQGRLFQACTYLVGYSCMLRTGELNIASSDCSFSLERGLCVISLGWTKGGKRRGEQEEVICDDPEALLILAMTLQHKPPTTSLVDNWPSFRRQFADDVASINCDPNLIKPYALRRGGATHHYKSLGNIDATCVRGRWQAHRTAKIYIREAAAAMEAMKLTLSQHKAIARGERHFQRFFHSS